jgi:hypothetical protein
MSWIDWAIVAVPIVVMAVVAFRMQRFTNGVAEL